MGSDREFREEILTLLRGPNAHPDFEEAVAGFPFALQGLRPAGAAHTPWELLEHLRMAQRDILEFCRDPGYTSPEFPDGYWPQESAPRLPQDWDRSMASFLSDRAALESMVGDPARDLLAPVPDEEGPSLLHEILIVAAHNSYHLGQVLLLRRALGA